VKQETKEKKKPTETVATLPEHGPLDENGREILLSVRNVDITFGKGDNAVKAVKNASFDIRKGETFSLVGESGSGKTTIGRAVIRVNPCAGGEILYKGVRISGKIPRSLDREVIRNIQMVFQDPAASLNERATVDYIISEGLYNFNLFENEADRVQKVENMITEVGLLPEHLTRYPHEFSGGQRQRIGLARAMVMEPELVIADEPISALDVSIRAQMLNLMKKFQQERGTSYLFIAHDLSIVRFISDRIAVIYKGDIVEIADAEELFDFPLHPYTRSLISAIPIPDPKLEKNKKLFTYDPSVHDYSKEKPELVEIGNNHFVYGSPTEIAEYKRIREEGVSIKPVTILTDEEKAALDAEAQPTGDVINEAILNKPLHDTGSLWYTIASFFLPIIGIIAGLIFKKKNHISNFKACLKGALIGIGVFVFIVALFLLMLWSATL
jgi:oligopeptide transport system ATP-binding protein